MFVELLWLWLLLFWLVFDGIEEIVVDFIFVDFGNICSYGGGLLICFNVDYLDGLFDIIMV